MNQIHSIILFITLLVFVECSSHSESDRIVLFKRQDIPKEWDHVGEALDKTEVRPFYIALKQRNLDRLDQMLYDVSHPRSPLYGQHFTYEQIMEVIAPPEEDVFSVKKWLIRGGVSASSITSRGDSLIVKASLRVSSLSFKPRCTSILTRRTTEGSLLMSERFLFQASFPSMSR